MRGPLEVKDIPSQNTDARTLGSCDDLTFNAVCTRSTGEKVQVRHKTNGDR